MLFFSPMNKFQAYKRSRLKREDKSSIEEIDKPILELCNTINSLDNFCTLSSCSGRVVLILDHEKKGPGLFLFRSHEKINFDEFKKELERIANETSSTVSLKQEPCLVTVACNSLESQREIFSHAFQAGFGRCGAVTTEKHFVTELMCTEKMEFPVIDNGKILVDDNFLKIIVRKSNENLEKSWKKIEKFTNLLKK